MHGGIPRHLWLPLYTYRDKSIVSFRKPIGCYSCEFHSEVFLDDIRFLLGTIHVASGSRTLPVEVPMDVGGR